MSECMRGFDAQRSNLVLSRTTIRVLHTIAHIYAARNSFAFAADAAATTSAIESAAGESVSYGLKSARASSAVGGSQWG